MGANARATAATKRGPIESSSSCSGGIAHATAMETKSAAYRRDGRGSAKRRATSIARYTLRRTPVKTSAFTNHVVPKSSANCTTLFVSSKRNAAPMKRWCRDGAPVTRL